MSLPRFNMFSMIHKALRNMLYEAAQSLQLTDFADTDEANAALGKLDMILELFDDHADHEDNFVLDAIRVHNPELIAMFEQEHVIDRQLCEALRSAKSDYGNASGPAERLSTGSKLFFAFNEFIAFNLQHMNKEETVLNETLWRIYTDQEIMAINGRLAGSVPPEKAIINITWMMRSCNNSEIINFINGAKKTAPPHLVNILMQTAEKELPAHRWQMVQEQTGEAIPA